MTNARRLVSNRPQDPCCDATTGWRLLKRIAVALVVLFGALVLAGLDVPGAKLIAVGAVFAFIALMYVGPWIGPRRKRRRG